MTMRVNKSERPIIITEIKRKKIRKVQLDLLFSESNYIDQKMHPQLNED
jgi:hypothetical protein